MHLSLLVIKTHQLEELVAFYECLGLRFQKHRHGNGPVHYACEGDEPQFVFEIYPLPKSQLKADTTTRLGFQVEHLDQLIEELKTKNIQLDGAPRKTPWGYTAIVLDSDGRKVELTQHNMP